MKKLDLINVCLAVLLFTACKKEIKHAVEPHLEQADSIQNKKNDPELSDKPIPLLSTLPDTTFVRLRDYSDAFVYDLRYATEHNFLKTRVYDCPECYVRVKTAKALLKANKEFIDMGYRIKFFDCYRPNEVQWKMWALVPDPQYVADPAKGSIHNKGGAVDITLVRLDTGKEIPMGTDFDYFGREAHHDYMEFSDSILLNRNILKKTMEKHGFWSIRTEWWHYNLTAGSQEKIADFKWNCPD